MVMVSKKSKKKDTRSPFEVFADGFRRAFPDAMIGTKVLKSMWRITAIRALMLRLIIFKSLSKKPLKSKKSTKTKTKAKKKPKKTKAKKKTKSRVKNGSKKVKFTIKSGPNKGKVVSFTAKS